MEISTEKVIGQLRKVVSSVTNAFAIKVIEEQALEIRELQATICRLKAEYLKQRDREHLERQVDYERSRCMREGGDD